MGTSKTVGRSPSNSTERNDAFESVIATDVMNVRIISEDTYKIRHLNSGEPCSITCGNTTIHFSSTINRKCNNDTKPGIKIRKSTNTHPTIPPPRPNASKPKDGILFKFISKMLEKAAGSADFAMGFWIIIFMTFMIWNITVLSCLGKYHGTLFKAIEGIVDQMAGSEGFKHCCIILMILIWSLIVLCWLMKWEDGMLLKEIVRLLKLTVSLDGFKYFCIALIMILMWSIVVLSMHGWI